MPELTVADERALEQLRTVHLLESTIGPKSIRRLEAVLEERSRDLVLQIEEDAARHRAVLENVIREWSALARPTEEARAPEPTARLSREEILQSFIEVKRSQAEVLRRAAVAAPTERIREALERVAEREDATASAVRDVLRPEEP